MRIASGISWCLSLGAWANKRGRGYRASNSPSLPRWPTPRWSRFHTSYRNNLVAKPRQFQGRSFRHRLRILALLLNWMQFEKSVIQFPPSFLKIPSIPSRLPVLHPSPHAGPSIHFSPCRLIPVLIYFPLVDHLSIMSRS